MNRRQFFRAFGSVMLMASVLKGRNDAPDNGLYTVTAVDVDPAWGMVIDGNGRSMRDVHRIVSRHISDGAPLEGGVTVEYPC